MGCTVSSAAGGDKISRRQQALRSAAPIPSSSVKMQQVEPKPNSSSVKMEPVETSSAECPPEQVVLDLDVASLTPILLKNVDMDAIRSVSTKDTTTYTRSDTVSLVDVITVPSAGGGEGVHVRTVSPEVTTTYTRSDTVSLRTVSPEVTTTYTRSDTVSLVDVDIDITAPSAAGGDDEKTGLFVVRGARRRTKKNRGEGLLREQSAHADEAFDEHEEEEMTDSGSGSELEENTIGKINTKQKESNIPQKYELDDPERTVFFLRPSLKHDSVQDVQKAPPATTASGNPLLHGFRIGKFLGKGAYGETFQAVRESDGKVFALKIARCADMDMANHSMAEVLNMIALPKHPNIVRYESCFITNAAERKLLNLGGKEVDSDIAIGIVMELCAGGDLKHAILSRRERGDVVHYPEDALLDIIIPCLQALAHIHSYKVIHRDIKPHNLLLDADGNVKLADFGEANMGEATDLAGTYVYMAPELLADGAYGSACDIWSLGCVMLDVITLTLCWERKRNGTPLRLYTLTQKQINELILKSTDEKYSENVKELLFSMLEKDPRKRSTAEDCLRKPFVTSWLDSQRFNDDENRDIFADMNMIASRASHKGCAPMYLAAASGLSQVCRYYFSYGVPLTQPRTDSTYTTPLFAAIKQGQVKTVSTLLELGGDPYEEVDGCHSMIWAAKNGQEEVVRTLVEKGVPVNHPASATNKTACQHVLDELNFDMIRVLLELGADSTSTDSSGHSVARVAMIHERKDVIQFLIDRNAPLEEKTKTTYIHLAASLGKTKIIDLLLNSTKFSVDDLDAKRATPLHAAVLHRHVEAVQQLVQRGANVNHLSASKTSPLFIASYVGSLEIVRLLLDYGADLTVTREDGSTPLAAACQEGHLEMVKFLLNHGASADTFDKYHRSPLQTALENGHNEIVSLLSGSASDSKTSSVPRAMNLQGNAQPTAGFGADVNLMLD